MKNINRGFTLIELMIAVAIIGILAAVGYPAYTNFVKTAQRSDAIHALLVESGRLEEFYLNNDSYATFAVASADSPEGLYKIKVSGTTAFAYLLTATRTPANDTGCNTLTYDQQGERKPAACWE